MCLHSEGEKPFSLNARKFPPSLWGVVSEKKEILIEAEQQDGFQELAQVDGQLPWKSLGT
jgi:hypothetical protein